MRRLAPLPLLAFALAAADVLAAQSARSAPSALADSLVSRLEGAWVMRGVVQGDSVTYTMRGERVLDRRYVRLHIAEVHVPPQYEAHVYVGVDSASAQLLVHWIDAFGAGASVPHGVGAARGDTLAFTFAYASGPFRDTFVYDRRRDSWHFLLESGGGSGWRVFADYRVTRR